MGIVSSCTCISVCTRACSRLNLVCTSNCSANGVCFSDIMMFCLVTYARPGWRASVAWLPPTTLLAWNTLPPTPHHLLRAWVWLASGKGYASPRRFMDADSCCAACRVQSLRWAPLQEGAGGRLVEYLEAVPDIERENCVSFLMCGSSGSADPALFPLLSWS